MEKNTKSHVEHCISLKDREKMTLSGVTEVVAFSESEITLKTSCGDLLIRGSSLNIGKLNTDTGELEISGNVGLIKYSKSKNNGGFFEGLFR